MAIHSPTSVIFFITIQIGILRYACDFCTFTKCCDAISYVQACVSQRVLATEIFRKKYKMTNMPHLIKCLSRPSQMSSQLQISWIPSFHPGKSLMICLCLWWVSTAIYFTSPVIIIFLSIIVVTWVSLLPRFVHLCILTLGILTFVAQKTLQHDIIFNFRPLFHITLMDFKEF